MCMYHVHMGQLNRRVHVLLDDDRLERLRKRAEATGTSVGAVVRKALDRELDDGPDSVAIAALESLLSASPLPVGTPEELDSELESMMDRDLPGLG
jgi:plasmid stability protein